MDYEGIQFDSDQEYQTSSRQRLGKRPAREVEDELEDEVDETDFDQELEREFELERAGEEARARAGAKAGASSASAGGSGSRSRPGAGGSYEEGDQQDDIDMPTFRHETLHAIFKGVWAETGTKGNKEAMQLSAEYLRLFTVEALHRTAAYQREQEDEELRNEETLIELDSLEAITPQLVLDF